MTTNNDTGTLNDLIEVLNDGKAFYEEAASKARADLATTFQGMARTKAAIAADLAAHVATLGEKPATGGTFFGSIRKAYAEMRTAIASDQNAEYVSQLEEFEDRILHTFRGAVENSDDPAVRSIAQRYLPDVKRDHDAMRALKQRESSKL